MADRTLNVRIIGDSRILQREFAKSSRAAKGFGRDLSRATRGAVIGTGAFRGLGNAATFASSAFLGGAGLTFALTKSVQEASDLNEEINKTRVVFRGSSRQILAWSKTSATALGLSRVEALGAAGAFGAMLNTSGVATKQASSMSRAMVQLAADMASFNNQDPSEMLDRLRSGLAGEAEPLRRFGILLSESRVQQEAVRSGLAQSGQKLTEQQKVLARYNLILRDTVLQQGDFGRTSGGLANQLRIVKAQIQNLLATVGQALLPIVTRLVTQLNDWLENSKNQVRVQHAVVGAVNFVIDAVKFMAQAVKDAKQAWVDFSTGVQRIWLELKAGAVQAALAIVEPFTHIPEFLGGLSGKARDAAQEAKRSLLENMAGLREDFNRLGRESATEFGKGFKSQFADVGPGMTLDIPTAGATGASGLLGGIARQVGRTGASAEQRNTWFDAAIGRQLDRVQDIKTLQGQVNDLRRIAALIKDRIAVTKDVTRKLTLEDQLVSVQREQHNVLQAIRDRTKQLADERKALNEERRQRVALAREARQFRKLGLTSTGDQPVAGVGALARRLGTLRKQVKGTFLDTTKTRAQFAKIASVLAEGPKKVGRDVRSAIQQMFSDINDALKKGTGTLTKFKKASANALLDGLGLSPDQVRALRSRLSQVGAGGTIHPAGFGAFGTALNVNGGTIVVNHTSTLDGQVVERSTTKHQQKRRRRNPPQKRGVVNP